MKNINKILLLSLITTTIPLASNAMEKSNKLKRTFEKMNNNNGDNGERPERKQKSELIDIEHLIKEMTEKLKNIEIEPSSITNKNQLKSDKITNESKKTLQNIIHLFFTAKQELLTEKLFNELFKVKGNKKLQNKIKAFFYEITKLLISNLEDHTTNHDLINLEIKNLLKKYELQTLTTTSQTNIKNYLKSIKQLNDYFQNTNIECLHPKVKNRINNLRKQIKETKKLFLNTYHNYSKEKLNQIIFAINTQIIIQKNFESNMNFINTLKKINNTLNNITQYKSKTIDDLIKSFRVKSLELKS